MANETSTGEQAAQPAPTKQPSAGERPAVSTTSDQPARLPKAGGEQAKPKAAAQPASKIAAPVQPKPASADRKPVPPAGAAGAKPAQATGARQSGTAAAKPAAAAGSKQAATSGARPADKAGAAATRPSAGAAKGKSDAVKSTERRGEAATGKTSGQARPGGERTGERRGGAAATQAKGTAAPTGAPPRSAAPVSSTRPGNNLPSAAHPSTPNAGLPVKDRQRSAGAPPVPAPPANAQRSAPAVSRGGPLPDAPRGGSGNGRGNGRGNGGQRGFEGTRRREREGELPPPPPLQSLTGVQKPVKSADVPLVTEIVIPAAITVRELAEKMRRSPIEVIKALMGYGIMVPITQTIDFDTAAVVGDDLGIAVKPERLPEPEPVAVKEEEAPKTLRQKILAEEKEEALVIRPPIVTVLGHVDHGKTTLLDAIRETRVVEGEAGGITQHIGAYQVERQGRKITFLDTPGHEAFTAMRARGAMVTDIAVLVVAADDGVMPQTKEAIAHARAARVPIVVALNKVDKPNASPERVKQELADNGVLIEEYGGDVVCVPVSAKFRRGIDDLLENILLVADIDPLKANPKGNCIGTVIESRLDKTKGPLATLLVQNGTLRVGDSIVAGDVYGKVRAMYDDKSRPSTEAPPSTPAVVLGLTDVAAAGDTFTVEDERVARGLAAERQEKKRAEATAAAAPKAIALENIFAQAEAGQTKELNLILKADVQGSIEPIVNSLNKLGDEKLKVKLLHHATGNITESDVMLAIASKAIILGFSVNVDGTAQRMAEAEGVDIRIYDIIYNLIEDVEKALKGLLEPVYKDVVLGHAEIRAVFRISKVGKIAGCYVTDGEILRNSMTRIKRGDQVLKEDKIISLKRFQEDAAEVKTGFECGLSFGNFNEFEVGDVVEAYKKERVS
jgi:translation initiation factor IF-2